jgi:hypothetical protein
MNAKTARITTEKKTTKARIFFLSDTSSTLQGIEFDLQIIQDRRVESKESGKVRLAHTFVFGDMGVFEIVIGLFAFAILCASIYALADPRVALQLIKPNTEGHVILGTAYRTVGDVRRKLIDDLLWLPIERDARIYEGDSVFCSRDSSIAVRFTTQQDLELGMNSLVRFEVREKRPLITVLKGELKVKSPGPNGLRVVASRDEQSKESTPAESPSDPSDEATEEVSQSPAPDANEPSRFEPQDKTSRPKIAQFPYPGNQTRILHSGTGLVTVAPVAKCEHPCRLTVSGAGLNLQRDFAGGEEPAITLRMTPQLKGEMTWQLTTAKEKSNGAFTLAPFSEEAFASALSAGAAVEIIGK